MPKDEDFLVIIFLFTQTPIHFANRVNFSLPIHMRRGMRGDFPLLNSTDTRLASNYFQGLLGNSQRCCKHKFRIASASYMAPLLTIPYGMDNRGVEGFYLSFLF